ncbi:ArsR family transcriptional regulator [Maribellus luteus]|uniref:ArsR family transcriptional regulator n=1 Tax=Maribellus luteus TaxID=2305463 RepID=A0A399SZ48_9BACT|nr:ArsR family transcriptional regulator [Maribellus luteus]RIJ47625.1 ArsR family transcriptional regulator [Maribellus luteus]
MLQTIITSKTRIKLLLKFFLNKDTKSYLRNLESEFGESTNAIRIELNRLESAGLLTSELLGNKKFFQANTRHPLFADIHNILRKTIGIDQIIEHITSKIGDLKETYLIGDLAVGRDSSVVDLLLIGKEINQTYVSELIQKAEKYVDRKIRYLIILPEEKEAFLKSNSSFLIWTKE